MLARVCAHPQCPQTICQACQVLKQGKAWCACCSLSIKQSSATERPNSQNAPADDFDCLEQEDFDELVARSQMYGTRVTASVKVNRKTGKTSGWKSVFALLETDLDNDWEIEAFDEADANVQVSDVLKRVHETDYTLKQVDAGKFLLETREGKQHHVSVQQNAENQFYFLGLPGELSDSVRKLQSKQIGENPLAALQAVVRERQLQQPV